VKLIFLGTRGYIKARTQAHGMHSSMLAVYYGKRVMVDCGEDWRDKINAIHPHAIVITHTHPDHSWGLKKGAPCPVYATEASWKEMSAYELRKRNVVALRKPFKLGRMTFEAFPVEHSTRAPAVGYRITAGKTAIFYVPDVVYIQDRHAALYGARLYIGDGATIRRSMVRKPGEKLIGHTPVRTQLTWCMKEGVPEAIITHCGSEIVKADAGEVMVNLRGMADKRGIEVHIAHDGMERIFH